MSCKAKEPTRLGVHYSRSHVNFPFFRRVRLSNRKADRVLFFLFSRHFCLLQHTHLPPKSLSRHGFKRRIKRLFLDACLEIGLDGIKPPPTPYPFSYESVRGRRGYFNLENLFVVTSITGFQLTRSILMRYKHLNY